MKDWTNDVGANLVKQILEALEQSPVSLSPALAAYRNKLRKIKEAVLTTASTGQHPSDSAS